MEVAIIYCKDCIFSQNTETVVLGYFDQMKSSYNAGDIKIDVKFYDLQEIEHQVVAGAIRKANVKIVMLSHYFLVHLKTSLSKHTFHPLKRILNSNGVIAVLVRISEEEVLENYGTYLPKLGTWKTLEIRAHRSIDPQFGEAFTEQVFKIYNAGLSPSGKNRLNIKPNYQDALSQSPPIRFNSKDELLLAKSIVSSNGQMGGQLTINSGTSYPVLTVMLDEVVDSGDVVRIELHKSGQNLDDNAGKIAFFTFKVPELNDHQSSCNLRVCADVNAAGQHIKSDSSKNKAFLDAAIQKLPAYRKSLDEYVSEVLLEHTKNGTNYEADTNLNMLLTIQEEKSQEFPTLMHLFVYYGLKRSVWRLLEDWNGLGMCEVQNCNSETPLTIAERTGSPAIGKMIKKCKDVMVTWEAIHFMTDLYQSGGLQKMSNGGSVFSNGNDYFETKAVCVSAIHTKNSTEANDDRNLSSSPAVDVPPLSPRFLPDLVIGTEEEQSPPPIQPRKATKLLSPDYQIPPEPRPVLPPKEKNKTADTEPDLQAGPSVVTKKCDTIPRGRDGYILMKGEDPPEKVSPKTTEKCDTEDEDESDEPIGSPNPAIIPQDISDEFSPRKESCLPEKFPNNSGPRACLLDSTDAELLEILYGVKAGVIDVEAVPDILDKWRDRPDVKLQSKEKEKAIAELRAIYARTAKHIDPSDTLFDRVIRTFGMSRRKKSATPLTMEAESRPNSPAKTPSDISPGTSMTINPLSEQLLEAEQTKEKVWGNAMSRKCVGVSYIEPSYFRELSVAGIPDPYENISTDTDQPPESTEEYVDIGIEKDPNIQTDLETTEGNAEIESELEETRGSDTNEQEAVLISAPTPPPIPPKRKILVLNFDSRNNPVRPPRKMKDNSLTFVAYANERKSPPKPDYTNSPSKEDRQTPSPNDKDKKFEDLSDKACKDEVEK